MGPKSSFEAQEQPALGVYSNFLGVSGEGRDWVARLPELWEKRCGGVVLRVTGVRRPGKRVASYEEVCRGVRESHEEDATHGELKLSDVATASKR